MPKSKKRRTTNHTDRTQPSANMCLDAMSTSTCCIQSVVSAPAWKPTNCDPIPMSCGHTRPQLIAGRSASIQSSANFDRSIDPPFAHEPNRQAGGRIQEHPTAARLPSASRYRQSHYHSNVSEPSQQPAMHAKHKPQTTDLTRALLFHNPQACRARTPNFPGAAAAAARTAGRSCKKEQAAQRRRPRSRSST